MNESPRLLDAVRQRIRAKHYSYRTEQSYIAWIRRYIHFHNKQHPCALGGAEIETFLTYLAVERNVAASTQNQALSSLLFLYREVLRIELPWLENVTRARRPERVPVVLSQSEVRSLLDHLAGTQPDGQSPLRQRASSHRNAAPPRARCGFRVQADHHPQWKRRQGSRHGFARPRSTYPGGAPVSTARPLRRSTQRRFLRCFITKCAAPQVPQCPACMGLAVHLPGVTPDNPSGRRPRGPSSFARERHPARDSLSGAQRDAQQAGWPAHAEALFCNTPAGTWLRHPHSAGTNGAPRRAHDSNLHARHEKGRRGRAQPPRLISQLQRYRALGIRLHIVINVHLRA